MALPYQGAGEDIPKPRHFRHAGDREALLKLAKCLSNITWLRGPVYINNIYNQWKRLKLAVKGQVVGFGQWLPAVIKIKGKGL